MNDKPQYRKSRDSTLIPPRVLHMVEACYDGKNWVVAYASTMEADVKHYIKDMQIELADERSHNV
jgi:hypothetical protein